MPTTPPTPATVYETTGTTGGGCDGVAHDQAYYLALFDRVMAPDWLAGLKTRPGGGYELLAAAAAVGARQSTAVERLECGALVLFADAGARASVSLEFYRPTGAAGTVAVKAGTRVADAQGREFAVDADATFVGAATGPVAATATAVAPGWAWNVPGPRTTAAGEALGGEVDRVTFFVQDPPYGDPTIAVRQAADATGGADPMLEGLGADRGLPRLAGEGADAYRLRVRTLPDTVSPAAVRRQVTTYLTPWGIGTAWSLVELWSPAYQTCWDAPSPNAGTPSYQPVAPTSALFDADLCAFDDPRPAYPPFRNRWLDEVEARGAFVVTVPSLAALDDCGGAYDDTASTPAAHQVAVGQYTGVRATLAYDVPANFTAARAGGYDGFDLPRAAVYKGLWELLRDIRLAGVVHLVELQGN